MFGNAVKPTHILILVIVIILLFGAKRLPDLARSVGQSLKIFKSEVKDLTDDKDKATPSAPVAGAPATYPAPATPPAPYTNGSIPDPVAATEPVRPAEPPVEGGGQPRV
ncbi:Sec-independent protein translocase subunit TatA [Cellulomonas sp. NPDC055163]